MLCVRWYAGQLPLIGFQVRDSLPQLQAGKATMSHVAQAGTDGHIVHVHKSGMSIDSNDQQLVIHCIGAGLACTVLVLSI